MRKVLVVGFAASMLLLAGVSSGQLVTRGPSGSRGQKLTPEQRLEKIGEVLKEYPPAPDRSDPPDPAIIALRDAAPHRLVRVTVEARTEPPPQGDITFQYNMSNAQFNPKGGVSHELKQSVKLVNGVGSAEFPVSATLWPQYWYRDCVLAGFCTRSPGVKTIGPGDAPMELRIQATPAGIIRGQLMSEAKPFKDEYELVLLSATDWGVDIYANHVADRYVVQTPLGGTYRLCALVRSSNSAAIALSEPLLVDDLNPIRTANLRLPAKLVTTSGRILRPDGKPFQTHEQLLWIPPWKARALESPSDPHPYIEIGWLTSDADGKFSLSLTASLPGSYELRILPGQDVPPQTVTIIPGQSRTYTLHK